MTTTAAATVILNLFRDAQDTPTATDDGAWTLYDFKGATRGGHQRVGTSTRSDVVGKSILKKIKNGLAFNLRFWDDWTVEWNMDDNASDGILVWEHAAGDMGAVTVAERRKDAQVYLKFWNNWYNGDIFGFSLLDDTGEIIAIERGIFAGDRMLPEVLHPELRQYAKSLGLDHIEAVSRSRYLPGIHNTCGTLYVLYEGECDAIEYLTELSSITPSD